MNFIEYFRQTFWVPMLTGILLPYIGLTKDKYFLYYMKRDYTGYIISCFMCEKIIIYLYYKILLKYNNKVLVQSGMVLTILLILSGRLINWIHYYLKIHKKYNKSLNFVNKTDRVFIMGFETLVCALDVIILDYKISLVFISLLLGKYFWIDSGLLTVQENYYKIKNDWKSVSDNAKIISFEFAIIILFSDYIGILLKRIINVGSYSISSNIAIISLGIILLLSKKNKK